MRPFIVFLAVVSVLAWGGWASVERKPLKTVSNVDIERFTGDWFVIGVIPTFLEKDAHNAVESYALQPDGTIATTFTFRKGSFDGPMRQYHPTGFVTADPSNAIWGMQFVWPIKAEYLIVHLDDAYTTTVIARNKRDHAWIMSRTPTMPDSQYQQLVEQLVSWGYERDAFVRGPQRW